ncbi:hypothetical protein [Streptomyces sp. NPDC010273]|uniref:hypothetical protein n=1 Tax=Streptomyces sp. NPDC010273 TaxID=3364829 RepID=UPI0036E5B8C6
MDTEARIGIAGLEEAYDEPRTVPAGARDPTLRAAVARARYAGRSRSGPHWSAIRISGSARPPPCPDADE